MYNSERFMEYAREYLDIEIEDLSVDQIADILADLSVEKAREILELIEKEEIEDIKKINRNIDEGEKEKEN